RELYAANAELGPKEVLARALRVGKEHVGALVNTLVLAYVGVALPLLLYVATLDALTFSALISSELFATEIVRTLLGSMGLILAVPLTTFAAAIFLSKTRGMPLSEKERHEGACGHAH
ncbi:MAG: YibE/F family protein, partial [Chloroflexota bacterium]